MNTVDDLLVLFVTLQNELLEALPEDHAQICDIGAQNPTYFGFWPSKTLLNN